MKKSFGILLAHCFAAILLMATVTLADEIQWKAEVKPLPKNLQGYGLPDYIIDVSFPKGGFPIEDVRQISHYKLTRQLRPEVALVIKTAKPKSGIGGEEEEATHEGKVATHAEKALLVPETTLDASETYVLEVGFERTNSGPITIAPAATAAPEKKSDSEIQRIIDFMKQTAKSKLGFTLDARTPFDSSKAPAFDYDLQLAFGHQWKPMERQEHETGWAGYTQTFTLASEGTIKLDSGDNNVTDHLQFSGNYNLMWLYLLRDPLANSGELAYFYGLRIKGFEFESDQRFRVVNYTLKPQFAAWLPYSNIPALWWSRQIGISGNAATPVFLFLGYTHVEPIKKDTSVVSETTQKSDRLEGELAYAFPLTSDLRVGFRGRFFWLFDDGKTANYKEVFARYYLNQSKSTSVIFKYAHGEVPPVFEKGSAASAGFSFSY
jgi:hypothetical protein